MWLAPEQARVIPITSDHNDYAMQLALQLKEIGVRAEADLSAERMNAKIRNAQLMKVPYMLVVGDAEQANHTLALRKRDGTRINDMSVGAFMEMVRQKIATRAAEL